MCYYWEKWQMTEAVGVSRQLKDWRREERKATFVVSFLSKFWQNVTTPLTLAKKWEKNTIAITWVALVLQNCSIFTAAKELLSSPYVKSPLRCDDEHHRQSNCPVCSSIKDVLVSLLWPLGLAQRGDSVACLLKDSFSQWGRAAAAGRRYWWAGGSLLLQA